MLDREPDHRACLKREKRKLFLMWAVRLLAENSTACRRYVVSYPTVTPLLIVVTASKYREINLNSEELW